MSHPVLEPQTQDPGVGTRRWMVTIYNNDTNSQDEVVEVLMRATGCGIEEAYFEMWEAHHFGKAPCHFSSRKDCEGAALVIASIGVKTEVSPEWTD